MRQNAYITKIMNNNSMDGLDFFQDVKLIFRPDISDNSNKYHKVLAPRLIAMT